jgi:hypothetical protein
MSATIRSNMATRSAYHEAVYGGGVNPSATVGHTYTGTVTSVGIGGSMVHIDAPDLPSTARDLFAPGVRVPVGMAVSLCARATWDGGRELYVRA